jgi:hypothetical protein
MNRRRFLEALGTAIVAGTSAGCVSLGTMDLVVQNCLDDRATVDVRVTRDDGGVVFEESVPTPGESCSDVVDGAEREDVFPEAGTYTVTASAPADRDAERRVEFSAREIEDNSDSVVVTLRADGLEVA